jgi:large repetitive protein
LTLKNKLSGCSSIANVAVVEDKTKPLADAGKDNAINCYQNVATLDAKQSSQGGRFKYDWTTVGGTIDSGNKTLSPKVSKAGKYILVVRDTLNGCETIDTVTVKEDKKTPLLTLTGETELNCKVKSIAISVSTSTPANYAYSWTTKNGQAIKNPTKDSIKIDKPGTYNVVVLNKDNGCKDSISTSISQVIIDNAKAGVDIVECDNTSMLSANLPTGTTGKWSTTGSATIASTDLISTDVSNLALGKNKFVWTLSSTLCPNYSADTVVVLVESKPKANDDVIPLNFSTDYINFNVTNNDKLSSIATWNIKPTSKPAFGNLDTTNILGSLRYKAAAGFGGEIKFNYKVCSKNCPVFCDSANVTLVIKNDNISKNLELPNIITPNGDGSNDILIFDILSFNPEKYKDNDLTIFNRWGDIVYRAKPYNNTWGGGNNSGQALPEGTYYYVLRLNIGEGQIVRSDVTIVR